MASFILTWNHTRWPWDDFQGALRTVQSGEPLPDFWSTGNNRQLQPDDQFFLFRQHDHQGIIGSGLSPRWSIRDRIGTAQIESPITWTLSSINWSQRKTC